MKLTTKDYVIVFIDGSRKFIPYETASALISAPGDVSGITIEGSFIKMHSISKILTIDEFYEEYPKERPDLKAIPNEMNMQIRKPTKRARELMIEGNSRTKGFRGYCEEHPEAKIANAALKYYDETGEFNLDAIWKKSFPHPPS